MPVRSVNAFRFAAMAAVGGVFSEMKLRVVPLNCFHTSPPAAPPDSSPPQPATPRSAAPASPVPEILRKSLRDKPPRAKREPALVSAIRNSSYPDAFLLSNPWSVETNTHRGTEIAPTLGLDGSFPSPVRERPCHLRSGPCQL